MNPSTIEKFWTKADRSRGDEECWPWLAGKTEGCGEFSDESGRHWRAPRFAWTIAEGPIPAGMSVCHHCGESSCVNPRHLFLADHAGPRARDMATRFWEKVDRAGGPEACWPWRSGTDRDGYGRFTVSRSLRGTGAHRMAYELCVGEIPDGMCVCHACDNPLCCNPSHLFIGTNADNVLDRHTKGRDATGDRSFARIHPERIKRGEQINTAKLTAQQVRDIRALYYLYGVTQVELAQMYPVNRQNISGIVRGEKWRHV